MLTTAQLLFRMGLTRTAATGSVPPEDAMFIVGTGFVYGPELIVAVQWDGRPPDIADDPEEIDKYLSGKVWAWGVHDNPDSPDESTDSWVDKGSPKDNWGRDKLLDPSLFMDDNYSNTDPVDKIVDFQELKKLNPKAANDIEDPEGPYDNMTEEDEERLSYDERYPF